MSTVKPGMGRGLAAILSVSESAGATDGVHDLPIALIKANTAQPRKSFDEEELSALAGSISEQGILQPVLVRPVPGGYELIAGERRWRAAMAAGLDRVPALVRPADNAQSLELALIENMARADLNPVEEARACAALAEELGLTQEEIGRRVGRSRVAIANLLRLLELPDEALVMLEAGELSEGHGRALLMAPGHDTQRALARKALRERWSVRETERQARAHDEDAARRRTEANAAAGGGERDVAAAAIAETLEAALGAGVKVRSSRSGGFTVELKFRTVQEAAALAHRLQSRGAAAAHAEHDSLESAFRSVGG